MRYVVGWFGLSMFIWSGLFVCARVALGGGHKLSTDAGVVEPVAAYFVGFCWPQIVDGGVQPLPKECFRNPTAGTTPWEWRSSR
jgi:hypothetical protein